MTIPGSAMGSTRMNDTASRPKNANLWTANDASEPRVSAIRVAQTAATIEVRNAPFSVASCHATENHLSVNSCGGHEPDTLLLKAYTTTMTSGT